MKSSRIYQIERKQALICQTPQKDNRFKQSCHLNSFDENDKQNYNSMNKLIQKSIMDQKQLINFNDNQSQITTVFEQSIKKPTISIKIMNNYTSPYEKIKFNQNIPSKFFKTSCSSCDTKQFELKKQYIIKLSQMQDKFMRQKQTIQKMNQQRFNQLWNKMNTVKGQNQKLKIINQSLQNKLKQNTNKLCEMKQYDKQILENNIKSNKNEIQQIHSEYKQKINRLTSKYESKIIHLNQNIINLTQQISQLTKRLAQSQQQFTLSLQNMKTSNLLQINSIKQYYHTLTTKLSEYASLNILNIEQRNRMNQQIYQQQIVELKNIIKQFSVIEELVQKRNNLKKEFQNNNQQNQNKRQSEIGYQIENDYVKFINMLEYVNVFKQQAQIQFNYEIKHIKQVYQQKIKMLYEQNQSVKSYNQILTNKIIQLNKQKYHNQSLQIQQNNKLINNKDYYDKLAQTQCFKCEQLSKSLSLHKKQLQLKQKQLINYQNILLIEQKQHQQSQQLYQKRIECQKLSKNVLKSQLVNLQEQKQKLQQKIEKIIDQKNIKKQNSRREQLERIKNILLLYQIEMKQKQINRLKQQKKLIQISKIQQKQQFIQLQQTYKSHLKNCSQLNKQTIEQILNKFNQKYQNLQNQFKRTYQTIQFQTKQSYQLTIMKKNMQIQQLSQSESQLIKININMKKQSQTIRQQIQKAQTVVMNRLIPYLEMISQC